MSVTPLHSQETPIGALRNALTIADMGRDRHIVTPDQRDAAFEDIARLIRHAIEGLSEPNLVAMQAGAILLKEWDGTPDERRQLRDTIQGILRAQLEDVMPPTWSEP